MGLTRGLARLILLASAAATVVLTCPSIVLASGGFVATGNLITPRRTHTATLLLDGRVFVICGNNGIANTGNAEIYNPATGTWSAAPGLFLPCIGNTATLLNDGRVLVGGSPGATGGTMNVYNPALNSWDSAGAVVPRTFYTATRLLDGRVVAAGGATAIIGEHSGAEIYNPATNAWTPAGFMANSRKDHTATLLQDGRILVVGGRSTFPADTPLAGAELYNPATNTWSATGNLNQARRSHTAVLLDNGKVLIVGGTGAGVLSSAEVYDPATGLFSLAGSSMGSPRTGHTAAKLQGGDVLIAGGSDGSSPLATAELFDPPTNGFQPIPAAMTGPREGHTATTLNDGRVLIAGFGAELYDPLLVVPACTLSVTLNYTPGQLEIQQTWTSTVSTVLSAWGSAGSAVAHLWSVSTAAAPLPVNSSVTIPVPQAHTIGILATMATSTEGILCSAWQTIDTGP